MIQQVGKIRIAKTDGCWEVRMPSILPFQKISWFVVRAVSFEGARAYVIGRLKERALWHES